MHFLQNITHTNLASINQYIAGWGSAEPLIVWVVFVIQAALPVFPYLVIAAAAGALLGFKIGFLVAWLGAVCGCCIGFICCKVLGAEWAHKKIMARYGYDLRQIAPEAAFWTIAIALIIPFVPTPLVNAAAGLSGISFRNFLASALIGKIPTAVLYTGLGVCMFGMRSIRLTLIVITCIIVLLALGRRLSKGKYSLTVESTLDND